MYSLLRQKAFNHEAALVRFSSRLSSLTIGETTSVGLSNLVQSEFQNLGYDRVIKDKIGNIVGCMYGRNFNPTLLLISHLSSVQQSFSGEITNSGGTESGWSCGLAAQIYAGRLLKECFQLNGNLIVIATAAEQYGCKTGIEYFLKETLPSLSFRPSYALLAEPTGGNLFYGRDGWIGIDINLFSSTPKKIVSGTKELYSLLLRISSRYSSKCFENNDMLIGEPVFSNETKGLAQIRIIHRLRHKNESVRLLHQFRELSRYVCKMFKTEVLSVGVTRRKVNTGVGPMVEREVSFPWLTDPFNSFFEEAYLALRTAQCNSRGGVWSNSLIGKVTSGDVLTNFFHIPTIGYGPGEELLEECSDPDELEQNLKEVFFGTAVIAHRLLVVPPKNIGEAELRPLIA